MLVIVDRPRRVTLPSEVEIVGAVASPRMLFARTAAEEVAGTLEPNPPELPSDGLVAGIVPPWA
jgi:hypothetical protein